MRHLFLAASHPTRHQQTRQAFVLGILLVLFAASSQAQAPANGDFLNLERIDKTEVLLFLVGTWTYETANQSARGTATYTPIENGLGIRESVEGFFQGQSFAGSALRWYHPPTDSLYGKWIDTMGNTLESRLTIETYDASPVPALVGSFSFGLNRFKHIWYNIQPDRFETDLLASQDNGATYQLVRRMPYIRVNE